MRPDPSLFRIRAQTSRQLRWGGAIIVLLGLVVLIIATPFVWIVMGLPISASWLPAGTHIEGNPGDGLASLPAWQRFGIFALVGWMVAAGITSLALGLWQLLLGRQHMGCSEP